MNSGFYGFPNILGLLRATAFRAVGKTGATAGATLAGGTTSGAPVTGAFDAGDAIITQDGHVLVCTTAGSPGSWTDAGTAGGLASPLTTTGDLWGFAGTNARISVGSDHQVLTADSTQASGVAWAAPQLSSPLVLSPNPFNFVDDSATDNGQPVDFITTQAGDVIAVGGL